MYVEYNLYYFIICIILFVNKDDKYNIMIVFLFSYLFLNFVIKDLL